MATLTGSFSKDVGSHWRVRCTWEAVSNTTGNYSNVTLKTYWESTDSYGTTNTSSTGSGSSTINGTRDTFSFSKKLTGKDSNLANTQTVRVNHNDDGTKSISLSATLTIGLTLGGTKYNDVTASKTITLEKIPRGSSITSSRSWTAGSDRTVTIDPSSTKYRHEVEIAMQNTAGDWTWLSRVDFEPGVTSASTAFTQEVLDKTFTLLAGRASAPGRMVIQTFDGSSMVGEIYYTDGTVTAPEASTATITNPIGSSVSDGQGEQTVYIDQTINLSIERANSKFTHTVRFLDSNGGTVIKEFTNVGTSVSWTPTTAEQNVLYAKLSDQIETDAEIEIVTYYNGIQVRSSYAKDINYRVRDAEPTFSESYVTYKDSNATTKAMTGNDQVIVQGKSILKVNISNVATAKRGATIAQYIVSINGQESIKTVSGTVNGTGEYSFPNPISAGTNQVLTVKVLDSRGLETTVTKTVTVVPYSDPTLTLSATRQNSFGEIVTVRTSGNFSSFGTNSIKTLQYRYKEQGASTYIQGWTSIPVSKSGAKYTGSLASISTDATKAYTIEAQVIDSLNGTVTQSATVTAGQPIVFIDSKLRSVGFNDLPKEPGEFRFNGRLVFGSSQFGSNGGGLDMNNSDIVGANGIYFRDESGADGEGLMFLRKNATEGSTNYNDYIQFHIDGESQFTIDKRPFMRVTGGGLVMIGSGNSVTNAFANDDATDASSTTYIVSDNTIRLQANWKDGASGRKQYNFNTVGQLVTKFDFTIASGDNSKGRVNISDSEVEIGIIKSGSTMLTSFAVTDTQVESKAIYSKQSSGTAYNVQVNSSGVVTRGGTSALKYKINIDPTDFDGNYDSILDVQPRNWHERIDVEEYADYLTAQYNGEEVEYSGSGKFNKQYGLIAEEVEEAGLGMFVLYEEQEDGSKIVEGLQYDRLWVTLIPIVKDLKAEVAELKARLDNVNESDSQP